MKLKADRSRIIAGFAVVAVASAAMGWTTSAGGITSTVTIARSKGKFTGTVQAASPCQSGRLVTVTKKAETVGTATTDANGAWELAKKRARGTFAAAVAASTVPGDGYRFGGATCDADASDPLTIKKKKKKKSGGGGPGLDPLFERLCLDINDKRCSLEEWLEGAFAEVPWKRTLDIIELLSIDSTPPPAK